VRPIQHTEFRIEVAKLTHGPALAKEMPCDFNADRRRMRLELGRISGRCLLGSEEVQMRFRLFPSFDGHHYTSPYFYTPPKKRWWPFLTGCAVGGVVVLVLVGRFDQTAESNSDLPIVHQAHNGQPHKLAAKKNAKSTTGRAEAQSEKQSIKVATMAEALNDAAGTARPQPADELARPQDIASAVRNEPDEPAIAKKATRQDSAQSAVRRNREARFERRKSTKALARAHQRDLDQALPVSQEQTFTAPAQALSVGENNWNAGSARDQSANASAHGGADQRAINTPSWQQDGTWPNAEARSLFGTGSATAERAPASLEPRRTAKRSRSAPPHGYARGTAEQDYRQAIAPERTSRMPPTDRVFGFDRGGPGPFVEAGAGHWRGQWEFGR
jgi:hypothetical protein